LERHIQSDELTVKLDDSNQMIIRLASPEDAKCIAVLCHQLGYPTTQEEMQRRLNQIQEEERHAVYVAELSNGHVVGWVHVYVSQLVITDRQAEIGGLVVDEGCRHYGIGELLMQQAEHWARAKKCWAVYLRSNLVRKGAHIFYERIGYSNVKTLLAFRKIL
jgi:N-acetylglutamate synthase-like GNAT family acetyltransferase